MTSKILIAVAASVLAIAAVACGDDDDSSGSTATPPVATPTSPPASPTPAAVPTRDVGLPTGIRSVDAIRTAVRGEYAIQLPELVQYQFVACMTVVEGIGGPPLCREGEEDGTPVEVVFAAACEGYYARENELPFGRMVLGDPAIEGAYEIPKGAQLLRSWPEAKYAVLLNETFPPEDREQALAILVDDTGIVGFSQACGETPEQFAAVHGLVEIVPGE